MIRAIGIEPAANGFIVQFGCQRLVYESIDVLVCDLRDYLQNPEETETRLAKAKCFNLKHTLGPMPVGYSQETTAPDPGPYENTSQRAGLGMDRPECYPTQYGTQSNCVPETRR